jgi:hypothetical protein
MSVKVYITIDTEEDQWGKYIKTGASVDNVTMVPILQKMFDRFGAIPTYLIDYPVVINENARHIIKEIYDDGRCGIGTHCHPWNTPPFKEEISVYNSMLCNLPYDLVHDKIKTLHQAIVNDWGVTPICFRAGRWGFGEAVARSIYELGYRIDTSITPFIDWSEDGGPNNFNAPICQYRFNPSDILSDNSQGVLLEVPPTIGFFQKNFHRCACIRNWILSSRLSSYHVIGILDKLRILNFHWLSPEICSGKDMVQLTKSFIKKGCHFINMSFHSTSLMHGLSPFVRTASDIDKFLKDIETFLQYAHDNRFQFVSLDKAIDD